MADTVYNRGKYLLTTGGVVWGTTDLRLLLLITDDNNALPAAAWDPDLNTVADLVAVTNVSEATGTGYVRKTLSGMVVTEDDTNNRAVLDADDITWTGLSAGTVRAAVVYKYNAADASAELISLHDTNFPKVTTGGDMTLAWPATGVLLAV